MNCELHISTLKWSLMISYYRKDIIQYLSVVLSIAILNFNFTIS